MKRSISGNNLNGCNRDNNEARGKWRKSGGTERRSGIRRNSKEHAGRYGSTPGTAGRCGDVIEAAELNLVRIS